MNMIRRLIVVFAFCAVFSVTPVAQARSKAHVLVISIDGMRPDYVTQVDMHGLKIPTLRALLSQSSYAEGVIGVLPTITYPSHTTIMTGVWPIEHGVYGNQKFDPFAEGQSQITEVSTIKVETLWEAAHRAGYTVASVGWPVTTGAKYIDWLLPANAAFEGADPDGAVSGKSSAGLHYDNPPGLRERLADSLPPGRSLDVDETRFQWQIAVIQRFKPEFMTAHIGNLDHEEHSHGPFSQQANAALELVDGRVRRLIDAERAVYPDAYIIIVSDHGFLPTDHAVSINALLMKEGLIDPKNHTWEAAAYNTGGTSAIIVRNPSDKKTVAKVKAVVKTMSANPGYGIGRVLTHEEVVASGGRPDALLMLDAAPGWRFAVGTTRDVIDVPGTGAHGQMPDHKELRSAFMLSGPGVERHHDLGIIDMRQIAPTIGEILGVRLPAAKLAPITFK